MTQDTANILSQAVRLHQSGKLAEAQAIYRQILAVHPDHPDALHLLGFATFQSGQAQEGLALIQRAISLNQTKADYYCNQGVVLASLNRPKEAMQSLQTALSIRPNFPQAGACLGSAYHDLAVQLQADDKPEEAIAAYRESIRLNPQIPRSHYNLSMMLLRRGEFAEAWPHYDYRWQVNDFNMVRRQFDLPEWKGEDLQGRRVLIQIEQGYGDLIQFVRYVPMIVDRGGKVVLECHADLVRLIKSVPGIDRLVEVGPKPSDVDLWCPMMNLPRIFGTSLETIPANVPYLWFQPQLADRWREKIGSDKRPCVGLVWNGRPNPQPLRSIPIKQLAPLASVPGVRFVSLQVGDMAKEAADAPAGLEIADWHQDIRDFADTAALMANLDLIITIDTAAAHLAGALARPTWLLLYHKPDWRWMNAQTTCRWYPTMRLFRQESPGNWQKPIQNVVQALRDWTAKLN
ncbi:MAG: tetratricopeptide repeat protein [Tepidisphaeraceae bacterium]